ncbi:hypothetical protein H6F32_04350 [Anabaena sp. FACHB-1237]|uniref:hypothetical protein n=1 Tax=Anabaena sp. FACHB-1237 TaxID=2692769 RepID=UPI0016806265|nr:hypothetical protein [Anabaena sp. FACHB-1237]MBD2136839.1 hypothetical protein [Anabaena sp. FACHB-1237]
MNIRTNMICKLKFQLLTLALISVVFCLTTFDHAYAQSFVIAANTQIGSTFRPIEDDFTPQEKQKMQGLIQRRNQEISKILDSSQQQKLAHELHRGSSLKQGLDAVNLPTEQRELVNSINVFTNLKLKGIISHHQLLDSHK